MDSAELWLLGARCPCNSNSYAIAVPLGNVDTLHCALLTRNKDADSAVPVGTTLMSSEYPGLHPISANLFWMFIRQNSHKIVILSAAPHRSIA
jgi:hypothetical protein